VVARAAVPCAIGLGVLIAAMAAAQVHSPLPRIPHAIVSASVFLLLLSGIAACLDIRLLELPADLPQLTALVTTVAGVFVAARSGLVGSPSTPVVLIGVVAYAAWIEELVFRRLLPRAFSGALGPHRVRSTTVGVVASQLLFAAAHFLPGLQNQNDLGVASLTRLFLGGLLFAAVVSRSGLAIGALLHAELNLRAMLPQPPPDRPTTIGVCLIATMAIGITASRSPPILTLSHRGTQHEKSCSWIRRWPSGVGRMRRGAVRGGPESHPWTNCYGSQSSDRRRSRIDSQDRAGNDA
jgi:hypothetical protein